VSRATGSCACLHARASVWRPSAPHTSRPAAQAPAAARRDEESELGRMRDKFNEGYEEAKGT
jgi:hypothetical protein